jgi:hypothetical protein
LRVDFVKLSIDTWICSKLAPKHSEKETPAWKTNGSEPNSMHGVSHV